MLNQKSSNNFKMCIVQNTNTPPTLYAKPNPKLESEKWSPRAKKTSKVIFLSLAMFFVAGVSDNLGKEILNRFDYPLTLSFVHLVSSSLYSIPLLFFMGLKNFPVTSKQFLWIVLPMAIIKSFSIAAGHFSISKISVAYSQIIKASLPIFTVVFGLLFFRTQCSKRVFCSLILILAGVVISSLTESNFSTFGLIFGLASTMGQSIQHIMNSRLTNESKVHAFELLALYARLSFLLFTPVWIFVHADGIVKFVKTSPAESFSDWQIPVLLAADGFLNFLENVFAFLLLRVVTAPSYSVVGASKRVITILASFIWFQSNVTLSNLFGISAAILGVFLYSYFRFKDMSLPAIKTSSQDENTNKNSREMIQIKPEENEELLTEKQFIKIVSDLDSNLKK